MSTRSAHAYFSGRLSPANSTRSVRKTARSAPDPGLGLVHAYSHAPDAALDRSVFSIILHWNQARFQYHLAFEISGGGQFLRSRQSTSSDTMP